MKKTLLSSLFLLIFNVLCFGQVHIPDVNFAKAIRENCVACIDVNYNLTKSADTLQKLYIVSKNIASLEGIQGFINLKYFYCLDNKLTTLPALPQSLTELYCNNNQLTTLPALPQSLTKLYCFYNQLTTLPALPEGLIELECDFNQLTILPLLPQGLIELNCSRNKLTTLPTLPQNLIKLYCSSNQFATLPILPQGLIELDCRSNQFTTLPILPQGLIKLYCGNNQFTTLPILPKGLIELDCFNIQLTTLPTLPQNLIKLYCSYNQLTTLPTLPQNLTVLYCDNNPKLSCFNSLLPSKLSILNTDNTNIKCLPNKPVGIKNNPLPICSDSNPNNCATVATHQVLAENIKIYPNPTSDKFFVETSSDVKGEFFLTNIIGQVIEYQLLNENEISTFDVQHLPKGVYILTLKTDKGKVSEKIVKD